MRLFLSRLNLCELLKNYSEHQTLQGRNITMDNLYSSYKLAKQMLQDFGATMTGTMRMNRKGLSKEITLLAGREDLSTEVYWEKSTQKYSLTSYVVKTKSKGKKNIIILSSFPSVQGVTKDEKKKPQIFKFYDFSKGGTDLIDQRTGKYTTSIKSNKWTKKAICFMLDVARTNSQTIFALNQNLDPRKIDSFEYGWSLALKLVMPHMTERRTVPGLSAYLMSKIDREFLYRS